MKRIKNKKKVKNKRGDFQFPFAWVFAIIVGMFILFLTIYGVAKFVNLQKATIGAKTSMSIGALTNPLESGFESERRDIIDTHAPTRIYTECDNNSIFGEQIIRTSEKTYQKWGEATVDVSFENKYIFSKNPVEGRYFYLFSKPFEFPFKVADLVYLTSTNDKYCFVKPPDNIEDQIQNLIGTAETKSEYENFLLVRMNTQCPLGSTKICFTPSGCDVNIFGGKVQKKGQRGVTYKGDTLMYAAIFSSINDYECQLDRLMNRTEQLFDLYLDKARFISQKSECKIDSELGVKLLQMRELIKAFDDSVDLTAVFDLAEEIGKVNEYAECKLW